MSEKDSIFACENESVFCLQKPYTRDWNMRNDMIEQLFHAAKVQQKKGYIQEKQNRICVYVKKKCTFASGMPYNNIILRSMPFASNNLLIIEYQHYFV